MYLGVNGSKQILKILNKKFSLSLDLKKIDIDIKELEEELIKSQSLEQVSSLKKNKGMLRKQESNYIG